MSKKEQGWVFVSVFRITGWKLEVDPVLIQLIFYEAHSSDPRLPQGTTQKKQELPNQDQIWPVCSKPFKWGQVILVYKYQCSTDFKGRVFGVIPVLRRQMMTVQRKALQCSGYSCYTLKSLMTAAGRRSPGEDGFCSDQGLTRKNKDKKNTNKWMNYVIFLIFQGMLQSPQFLQHSKIITTGLVSSALYHGEMSYKAWQMPHTNKKHCKMNSSVDSNALWSHFSSFTFWGFAFYVTLCHAW